MNLTLRTFTRSQDMGIPHPSASTAGFQANFFVSGNSENLVLPLQFNFETAGSLTVRTSPLTTGSVGLANVNYNFLDGNAGFAQLASQGGVAFYSSGGAFPDIGVCAEIKVSVNVEGTIIQLDDEDLLTLGLDQELATLKFCGIDTTDIRQLAAQLAAALFAQGLPSLEILPGIEVGLEFEIVYTMDFVTTLTKQVRSGGLFFLTFISRAHTTGIGLAEASFDNTMSLRCVTLPSGYEALVASGLSVSFDSGLTVPVETRAGEGGCGESTLTVDIDIKPGSDPNSINTQSRGVIPVAILGASTFDVTDVDVTTLMFGPCTSEVALSAHDLSDPATYADHLQDVNGDGLTDLVSHYHQNDTGLSLGDTEACLLGATIAGTPISGMDAVNIVN